MPESSLPRSRRYILISERKVLAMSILIIVFASVILWQNLGLSIGNVEVNAQKNAAGLEQYSQSNVSIPGLDAVRIYAISNRSIVTVQGVKIIVVETRFGPQKAIQSELGSGFVIQYTGSYYIATNFHVVDGLTNVTVTFWDGNAYTAKAVGSDPYVDIALVFASASADEFYPLQLASSSSLRVGDPVAAIGNPYGLSGSITFGIVSQLGRTIEYDSARGSFPMADVIQLTAPINPGNSGGPLLNADGMVVGVTTAAIAGSQGVGFAIPSDTLLRELPSLVRTGTYNMHPYLGIEPVDMNYQLSQVTQSKVTYGVLIEKVVQNEPASLAGLRGGTNVANVNGQQYLVGGDIIISINGARIVNNDVLSTYLERYTQPGQTIRMGIIRSGNPMTLEVTLAARPLP